MTVVVADCGSKVVVSTSEGNLYGYKWDEFGDFTEKITGHKVSIDAVVKLDEDYLVTGCDDGYLRIV